MKKVITKVFMFAAVLAGINVLSSCKDYDEDKYYENSLLNDKNASDLKDYVDKQDKLLKELITTLEDAQKACQESCTAKWTELGNLIIELQKKDVDLQNAIDTKADKTVVDNLTNEVNALKDRITKVEGDIATLNAFRTQITTQITNIENRLTTVEGNITNLQSQINDLKAAQDKCKSDCQTKFNELNTLIEKLQNEKADKTTVDALSDKVNELVSAIDKLQSEDIKLQGEIDGLKSRIDALEGKVNSLTGKVNDLTTNLANNYYTITQVNNLLSSLKNELKNYIDQKIAEANNCSCGNFQEQIDKINNVTIPELQGKITEAMNKANEAAQQAELNKATLENLINNTIPALATKAELDAVKDDLQKQIDDLAETSAKNLETAIAIAKQLDAELKVEMLQEIADAIADYDANLQQQLTTIINSINTQINQVKQDYQNADTNLQNQIDAIDAAYKAADAALKSELVTKIAEAKQEVLDILNPKITDLQNKYTELVNKDTDLQNQINTLKTQVEKNTADIKANKDAIDELTGRVDNIEETLNKMVTGITVQGTYNPVFGSFAFPVGIQSNILMSFMGSTDQYVSFPTTATGNYPFTDQALTAAEAAMIGSVMDSYTKKSGKTLISTADDNAGTLYVTVNPNTVDFTGAQLKLENSQAKSAGIDLSPLAKSDKTLAFGYTRAADNGFYEAKAKINDIDAVQKINLNKTNFKNIASEMIRGRQFNLTEAADALYDELHDFLDANAAVATWSDANGDHSVYSQYNIAATAIHPLSFAFAKDFSGRQTLPGYERLESFIDRIANEAKKIVTNNWPDLTKYMPGSDLIVKIDEVTKDFDYKIKFSLRIQTDKGINTRAYKQNIGGLEFLVVETWVPTGVNVDVDNETGNLQYEWRQIMKIALNDKDAVANPSGEAYVSTDINGDKNCNTQWDLTIEKGVEGFDVKEELNNIIGDVNGAMDKVQDFLDDVNDLLEEINNFDSSFTSGVDRITDLLKNYLQKFNDKFIDFIDAAIARLQPCLLISTPAGTKVGTNAASYPTEVNTTEVTLIPTSYTAEIITPAFKKHVACVNVVKDGKSAQGGDSALKSELNSVNAQENMNTVIDGSEKFLRLNLKKGYKYQFAYSALDFSGKICTKRAWVIVR